MIQIGIDFGGTKIEAAALDASGRFLHRQRVANPGGYDSAIAAVKGLVEATEGQVGPAATIGQIASIAGVQRCRVPGSGSSDSLSG